MNLDHDARETLARYLWVTDMLGGEWETDDQAAPHAELVDDAANGAEWDAMREETRESWRAYAAHVFARAFGVTS